MMIFIEKHWYYLLVIVRFSLDIPATVYSLGVYTSDISYYAWSSPQDHTTPGWDSRMSDWFTPISLGLAFWLTASANSVFLLTFDFVYTGTILGDGYNIGCASNSSGCREILSVFNRLYLFDTARFCHIVGSLRSSLEFRRTEWSWELDDQRGGPGIKYKATLPESNMGRRFEAEGFKSKKTCADCSQAIRYVRGLHLQQHVSQSYNVVALSAIVLILTRVVILLTQLQNEDFQTRTRVQECSSQVLIWSNVSLLVGHPEDRGVNTTQPALDISEYSSQVQIALGDFKTPFGSNNSSSCTTAHVRRLDDLLSLHPKPDTIVTSDETWQNLGFRYVISPKNVTVQAEASDLPRLWFQQDPTSGDPTQLNETVIPYLIPPLEPSPGMHTLSELYFTERRFITSSGILDAITGSKPTYGKTTILYQLRYISSRPIYPSDNISTGGNYQNIAYGTVLWPTFITSSLGLTEAELGKDMPGSLCQVVEDYRTSSAFDVLGSIGGLLALLQGIHVFLFGRPLFWGLFGTKLITPFGLLGKLATKGFRRRLQEHYYPSDIHVKGNVQEVARMQDEIDMTRFLLDYVLDVGPASTPNPNPKAQDTLPLSSDVELRRVSQNQDMRHRHSNSVMLPMLAVKDINSQPGSHEDDWVTSTASSANSIVLKP
ncbi:hypothetical protein BDV93DRAFT_509760 [Ceratobasidium sp. AG-I]|nr:hypothetical protein BDV93DRAFT_509760 [Ceratobasidium sp. AG-I]